VFRTFAIAAILSLTAVAAQAQDTVTTSQTQDNLAARVHQAAVKACAAKVGDNLPISYYRALSAHCADRVSADALATIRARQTASAAN
jgi:hypothetical protein